MERYSISIVNKLNICGMLVHFDMAGMKERMSMAAVQGIAAHRAIETDLKRKIETGSLVEEEEELVEETFNAFDAFLDQPNLVKIRDDEDIDECRDRAARFALMHHDKVAPNLRPWKVEERVDLIVRQLDARISMYVDVIERIPGHPPQFRVRDTKTASRKPAQQAADISAQLQLYGLGVQKKFGPVSDVHLDCLVQTKTAAHVEHRESPLTNVRPALLRMEHAIKQIRAGAFMPAPPDHWKCSDKWCDFWANDCPFGRRSRTSFQTPEIPKD